MRGVVKKYDKSKILGERALIILDERTLDKTLSLGRKHLSIKRYDIGANLMTESILMQESSVCGSTLKKAVICKQVLVTSSCCSIHFKMMTHSDSLFGEKNIFDAF